MKVVIIMQRRHHFFRLSENDHTNFGNLNPIRIAYESFDELPQIIQNLPDEVNEILFLGPAPYSVALPYIRPNQVCIYIPPLSDHVINALFEGLLQGFDITRVSFDTHSEIIIREVYQELQYRLENISPQICPATLMDFDYNQIVYNFHKLVYEKGLVSFCITTHSIVSQMLTEAKIPNVQTRVTISTIREYLSKLHLNYLANELHGLQIVVISVLISWSSESFNNVGNEYQFMLERLQIAEQIYAFAQRISAAVVEEHPRNFLLFGTKAALELETNHFQNISLLDMNLSGISNTISLGIGFGKTAIEAKHNANVGVDKSKRYDRNTAYVVYSDNIIGPLVNLQEKHNSVKLTPHLSQIASAAGISIKTILDLRMAMEEMQTDIFVAKDLARYCNCSARNIDRILTKLEMAGYMEITGQMTVSAAGRPSRIIRLKI